MKHLDLSCQIHIQCLDYYITGRMDVRRPITCRPTMLLIAHCYVLQRYRISTCIEGSLVEDMAED